MTVRLDNVKVNVRISRKNRDKLDELSIRTGVPKGRIIDDAMTEFFSPPLERPDSIILKRISRVDQAIDETNGNINFLADMVAEFVWQWLMERPAANPFASDADKGRAMARFEDFTQRVVERSQEAEST